MAWADVVELMLPPLEDGTSVGMTSRYGSERKDKEGKVTKHGGSDFNYRYLKTFVLRYNRSLRTIAQHNFFPWDALIFGYTDGRNDFPFTVVPCLIVWATS
jgi:hypothetical protein